MTRVVGYCRTSTESHRDNTSIPTQREAINHYASVNRWKLTAWYIDESKSGSKIEGREQFVELIDAFAAVIPRRHTAMLEFLAEPRTIDEMTAHRFIYRPHVDHVFADSVERRCAEMHVARMLARGEAVEVEPGRYQAA